MKEQMKEQLKTPEKGLNTKEISDLSDAEFKKLVIRVLKKLAEDLNGVSTSSQKQRIHSLIEIKNNF